MREEAEETLIFQDHKPLFLHLRIVATSTNIVLLFLLELMCDAKRPCGGEGVGAEGTALGFVGGRVHCLFHDDEGIGRCVHTA